MSEGFNQEYVFVWRIQNFSTSFHKSGEAIESPVFTIDTLNKSQWVLRMYPRGISKENSDFISVYLNNKNSEEYELDSEIELIGTSGNILITKKFGKDVYMPNLSWGYSKFVKIKTVSDQMKEGLDDLTFHCRVFFNSQQNKPDCKATTEICVDHQTFVWNIRIPDISNRVVKKELQISTESVFEVLLNMPQNSITIDILLKKESPKTKCVSCKMTLIDSKGKKLISKSANYLFEANIRNETREFPVFITKTFLDDNKSAFVEKDTICLLCKCVASNGTVTNTISGPSRDFDTRSTLQMQYNNMLLDNTYSDIKLKAGNEVFPAHKCVLAVCSPVFSAMFQQDMIESRTNTVDIHDVEANTLKSFLHFIYTETLENFDYDTAKKLLLVAEKYQVLTLKEKRVSFLESVVSLGNVFEILSLADLIGHERLKCAAVNIVVSNSDIVLNLPDWSVLIRNNTKLATEIISKIVISTNNAKSRDTN